MISLVESAKNCSMSELDISKVNNGMVITSQFMQEGATYLSNGITLDKFISTEKEDSSLPYLCMIDSARCIFDINEGHIEKAAFRMYVLYNSIY